jgi:ubiquinol-cytochrome c reductase cytochrome b subunit
MAVDYRKQYSPEQLTPFWPNELLRLIVASLCALAVLTALSVLPVLLDYLGLGHWIEAAEPANPHATPEHIRPEWYFLAVYQYLKLPPQELLGVSGKSLGVLSQGLGLVLVVLLPFWARRWSQDRPGVLHGTVVTLVVTVFVGFTLWAIWPPRPLLAIVFGVALTLFYVLLINERRRIRRILKRPRGSGP